ncbi:hypothetical protein B296_00017423 [Ensete ventricosum]|uniref:Rapid alkalinization factor 1 n=1 Tax=Ensete ventricosum TaxID=4639 RepID=A0A427AYK0_ENSVE|nr:hypothetical protein B296_00017423 [Ensete ventricosum]
MQSNGKPLPDRASSTGLRRESRDGGTSLSGEIFEKAVLADTVLEAELLPELHPDLVAALPHLDGDDLARHLCDRNSECWVGFLLLRRRMCSSFRLLVALLLATPTTKRGFEMQNEGRARVGIGSKEMTRSTAPSVFSLGVLLLLVVAAAGGAQEELSLGWIPARSGCRGNIAECLAGVELDMGTEASRRILAWSSYISYNALRRDSVPCSRRGASYYNCLPGAHANPYSRSCSAITRCRK